VRGAGDDGRGVRRGQRAGNYLVAFVQENAEGMYELEDGRLVWREAPEEANAHLEIAVVDAADGRFVPAPASP
jgi:hypothetical protein